MGPAARDSWVFNFSWLVCRVLKHFAFLEFTQAVKKTHWWLSFLQEFMLRYYTLVDYRDYKNADAIPQAAYHGSWDKPFFVLLVSIGCIANSARQGQRITVSCRPPKANIKLQSWWFGSMFLLFERGICRFKILVFQGCILCNKRVMKYATFRFPKN